MNLSRLSPDDRIAHVNGRRGELVDVHVSATRDPESALVYSGEIVGTAANLTGASAMLVLRGVKYRGPMEDLVDVSYSKCRFLTVSLAQVVDLAPITEAASA